jgi:hypothetical protein
MRVEDDVLAVLSRAETNGNALVLVGQLDSKLKMAEEIGELRALISDAADFWSHYSCVNEGEQDDMNEERLSMLERMNAAGHNAPHEGAPALSALPLDAVVGPREG